MLQSLQHCCDIHNLRFWHGAKLELKMAHSKTDLKQVANSGKRFHKYKNLKQPYPTPQKGKITCYIHKKKIFFRRKIICNEGMPTLTKISAIHWLWIMPGQKTAGIKIKQRIYSKQEKNCVTWQGKMVDTLSQNNSSVRK